MSESITEEWLKEVGFKWHQFERQPGRHWLLWLNRASTPDDIGIEVAALSDDEWFCWLRSDLSHRYSRFIYVRHLTSREQLIKLVEAITCQEWNPENHMFGQLVDPDTAARWRKDRDERLDLKWMLESPNKWREIEKDDSMGGALPEHLEAHQEARQGS